MPEAERGRKANGRRGAAMTDYSNAASPTELAQTDLLCWLITHRYLTPDGEHAVRAELVTNPAHRSIPSRAALVLVIRAIAKREGWPASDDPHWPGPDDDLWGAVPLPDVPDDAAGIVGRW